LSFDRLRMHPSPLEFILSKLKGGDSVCMLPSWFDKLTMTNSGACPELVEGGALHLSIFEQPANNVKRVYIG
jgi:hypothetical protein